MESSIIKARVLFTAACILFLIPPEEISVTRNGETYRVNTSELPVSESGALSIARTAELATQALSANIVDMTAEKKQKDEEIVRHVAEVEVFIKAKGILEGERDQYLKDVENHNWGFDQYKKKVGEHNTAVAASDALQPKDRNQAHVDHLNAQKVKLDEWAIEIDRSKSKLDTRRSTLSERFLRLTGDHKRLTDENEYLKSTYDKIMQNLGLAYRQLKQLVTYANSINEGISAKNWSVNKISQGVLFGSNELIKESSNHIFDGNRKEKELKVVIPPFVMKSN